MVCLASVATWFARKTRIFQRQRLHDARVQVYAALETTQSMNYCAAFIRASEFCKLGTLQSHEMLRDNGKLVYRDNYNDLANGDDYT